MTSERDRAKILANKNIGVGMIYGAGPLGLATSVYLAATGSKPAILLFFLEAAITFTGVAKALRAYGQTNKASENSGFRNGPR